MHTTYEIDRPITAIVHYKTDEDRAAIPGGRLIYYQVTIHPDNFTIGGFVRFESQEGNEMHGWQDASNIVIDEVLGEVITVPAVVEDKRIIQPEIKKYEYTDYAKANEEAIATYFDSLREDVA